MKLPTCFIRSRYWNVLAAVLCCSGVHAQTPRSIPASYASATGNFIRAWDAKAPEQDPNNLMTRGLREVQQTTKYLDVLGRPLQTVAKQGSYPTGGSAVDMTSMVEYDELGREVFKYLSSPANNTGGNTSVNDGAFKLNPFAQQAAFYNASASSSPLYGQNETFFYGETRYEASPLNRVTEVSATGNSWSGTMYNATEASRRSQKTKYYVNTATDAVRFWAVTEAASAGSFGSYASPSAYGAGQLDKTIAIDEQGNQVVEFKDKSGNVVLKKVQLSATADNGSGSDHTGWLCTYYIYDDIGHLRCVLQPRGVELIASGWLLTNTTILDEQCFRYEYDERNRMILKKVPGSGQVDMVYDVRDRLVMTQDANLKAGNQYLVTKYDALNRPVEKGLWTSTVLPQAHRNNAKITTTPASNPLYPVTTGTYEYLAKTGYDDYSGIPSASGLTGALDNTTTTSTYGFYTSYNISPAYAQSVTGSTPPRGLTTWTEVKILGTATSTYAVNVYDDKARTIQAKSKNQTGGADLITTQYNWTGQPLVAVQKQVNANSPAQTSFIVTLTTYDDLGRAIQTDKKIQHSSVSSNTLPSVYTTVVRNSYDAIGQLKTKNLGNKPGAPAGTSLAKLDYNYNIRGSLLDINKGYMAASSNADQYFAMELGYDKNASYGAFVPRYNGSISGILWKTEGDQERRKYDFGYDPVNRLAAGSFTQYVSGSGTGAVFNTSANVDFSLSGMTYDANGNIKSMTQKGLRLNASPVIDQLNYEYLNSEYSNKLRRVTDGAPVADNGKVGDFKDGANGTADDYTYDPNGNLATDQNKSISSITYNYLSLPQVITVAGKGSITYSYDASGARQKKTTAETTVIVPYNGTNITTGITTTTLYQGGFVYESKSYVDATLNTALGYANKLQLTGQEEGRIRALYNNASTPSVPTGFAYDYFLKDHLGNTRVVVTEEVWLDTYPAATLEGSLTTDGIPNAAYKEKDYYNINSAYVVASTAATGITNYPNNNGSPPVNPNPNSQTASNSAKLYKLNSGSNKTGLGITLKVMAGDKIDIFGKSYYFSNNTGGTTVNSAVPVLEILTGLLGGPTGGVASGAHGGVTASQLNGLGNTTAGISTLLGNETTDAATAPTVPKAYINYIFFDDQFKSVKTGFSKVGSQNTVKSHTDLTNVLAPKNGYVYIYVSNESPVDVFFDNLQVLHTRGQILEETHYYPFGLTMAGISDKAMRSQYAENKYRYNKGSELQNKEFSDGTGLEIYTTNLRDLDPQLGRWWQIDPKPNMGESPYAAMGNDPVLKNDPFGDTARIQFHTGFLGLGKKMQVDYNEGKLTNKDGSAYTGKVKGFLRSAVAGLDRLSAGGANGQSLVNDIVKSTQTVNIIRGTNSFNADDKATGMTNVVRWSPGNTQGGPNASLDQNRPAFIGLGHELAHADDQVSDGRMDYSNWFTPTGATTPVANAEKYATHIENLLRAENGISLRAYYSLSANAAGTTIGEGNVLTPGTTTNANFPTISEVDLTRPGRQRIPYTY